MFCLSGCGVVCFATRTANIFNIKESMVTGKGILCVYEGKGKGKVHPRTGHEGPEGEQMYSCTLPSTSALDWGGCSTPRPGSFTPGKDPVLILQEAGWAPGSVWTGVENLAPHRDSIPAPPSP